MEKSDIPRLNIYSSELSMKNLKDKNHNPD